MKAFRHVSRNMPSEQPALYLHKAHNEIRPYLSGIRGLIPYTKWLTLSQSPKNSSLWAIKNATIFWTITPTFLGGFLHFLYQWKQE